MLTVRDASELDAAACAAIYAPYVTQTAISFEAVPPPASEMSARISAALSSHAWLVAEDDGPVVGYAYGGPFASAGGLSVVVRGQRLSGDGAAADRGRAGALLRCCCRGWPSAGSGWRWPR